MEKINYQMLNKTIKIQKSLIRNGKTPHIRDQARYRLKMILENKRKMEAKNDNNRSNNYDRSHATD